MSASSTVKTKTPGQIMEIVRNDVNQLTEDDKDIVILALAEEIEKRKAWINHNLGKKQPKHEARKILKEKREELATMKKIQRSEYGRSYAAIKALKNMEKDKKNLLECLVVLGQGGETDETIAG